MRAHNREEETRTLNLGLNAGFLAGVVLVTGAMILGVDSVSRGRDGTGPFAPDIVTEAA